MQQQARDFYQLMSKRRSVRDFSNKPVPASVLEDAILAAGTAPSGANMQPWHFVVVQDQEIKQKIREAAEIEERELYENRASEEWLDALAPLGTDANKPFLETAPALIAIFLKKVTIDENGGKHKNYYTSESVGIATGVLITALHNAGLATLTLPKGAPLGASGSADNSLPLDGEDPASDPASTPSEEEYVPAAGPEASALGPISEDGSMVSDRGSMTDAP